MPSKLSYHIQKPEYPEWLRRHIRESGVRVLKILDPDHGEWDPFPSLSVLGRLYFSGDSDKQLIAQGAAGAEEYYRWCEARIVNAPWVEYWEGPNEPDTSTVEALKLWAAFERRRVGIWHEQGWSVASGQFSTGTPQIMPMSVSWEIIGPAIEDSDLLAVHEYGMRGMDPQNDGWHLLRYRKAVAELVKLGLRVPPIVITETGIDYDANPEEAGWQHWASESEFLHQLSLYDDELLKDDYVWAATPFTWMHMGWPSFDVYEGMSEKIANYIYVRGGGVQHPSPTPPGETPGLNEWIGDQMQAHVIPQNVGAHFYQLGRSEGWEPISGEVNLVRDNVRVLSQVWYVPSGGMQHIVAARVDERGQPLNDQGQASTWGEATWFFDRPN